MARLACNAGWQAGRLEVLTSREFMPVADKLCGSGWMDPRFNPYAPAAGTRRARCRTRRRPPRGAAQQVRPGPDRSSLCRLRI